MVELEKVCVRCSQPRRLANFHPGNGKYGRKEICLYCLGLKAPEEPRPALLERNGSRVAEAHRLKLPAVLRGRQIDAYRELWEKQGGCCFICQQWETVLDETGERLPLSLFLGIHDGKRIQALLCKTCGLGLSAFRDSPALLARAIELLTRKTAPFAQAEARIVVQ